MKSLKSDQEIKASQIQTTERINNINLSKKKVPNAEGCFTLYLTLCI